MFFVSDEKRNDAIRVARHVVHMSLSWWWMRIVIVLKAVVRPAPTGCLLAVRTKTLNEQS